MIEIFSDVPETTKILAKFWVDLALEQSDPMVAAKIVNDYAKSCGPRDQEYIDFYFNMRLMEQMKNEDIDD